MSMTPESEPTRAAVSDEDREKACLLLCAGCYATGKLGCKTMIAPCEHSANAVAQALADAKAAERKRCRVELRDVIGKPVHPPSRLIRDGDIEGYVGEADYRALRTAYNRVWAWAYQDIKLPGEWHPQPEQEKENHVRTTDSSQTFDYTKYQSYNDAPDQGAKP